LKIVIENNIAEVWCTSNKVNSDKLELLVKSLRLKKYTVVIFKSGSGDLSELTAELLRINKN